MLVGSSAGMDHVIGAAPNERGPTRCPRCQRPRDYEWGCQGEGRKGAARPDNGRRPRIRQLARWGAGGPAAIAGTAKRGTIMPLTLTCNRSTEESTLRAVPPLEASSPKTFQGSSACRSSRWMPRTVNRADRRKAKFEVGSEPLAAEVIAGPEEGRATTSSQSSCTKCGSMKRSCRPVPQRTNF